MAGVLPLTVPRELDHIGVEFLTNRGGKPVCVDLFSYTQHALITGKTGSGKSVLLWRFMLDALSQGIPIAGGGGVALYTGINSRVAALVNVAFDGVVAIATGLAGKTS
ncbi:hypothetical protein FIS3754_43660 [Fischerella sp. NIES-3754]|nr:hypothetical protein FIS3754_43660 [Fischerella sp. NIES-3754]BCX10794.1 MAG: hypothetical protein KatS3mg066_4653 [Fischerella sp.]